MNKFHGHFFVLQLKLLDFYLHDSHFVLKPASPHRCLSAYPPIPPVHSPAFSSFFSETVPAAKCKQLSLVLNPLSLQMTSNLKCSFKHFLASLLCLAGFPMVFVFLFVCFLFFSPFTYLPCLSLPSECQLPRVFSGPLSQLHGLFTHASDTLLNSRVYVAQTVVNSRPLTHVPDI